MESHGHRQREPQSLEAWESWVDRLIVDAQKRGDFDNLPGHGKPLKLEDAPFAGGLEVGFGILKNAGIAPYWIELEKELRSLNAELEELKGRASRIARERAARQAAPAEEPPRPNLRWWWPFGRRTGERVRAEPAVTHDRFDSELAWLRRQYLEKSAEMDKLISQYNAAIPRDLWHLERPRVTPEAAAQEFDRAAASASESAGGHG